jgi:micrococcal nuclease
MLCKAKRAIWFLHLVCLTAFCAPVTGVADGDTITVLIENHPVRIRLANIDAPEKSQAYGARSKESLSNLCFGKDAVINPHGTDRYERIIAEVQCDGVNANAAQVQLGMAWVYTKYNSDPSLLDLEKMARISRRGLWAEDDPVAPWQFRKEIAAQRREGLKRLTIRFQQ